LIPNRLTWPSSIMISRSAMSMTFWSCVEKMNVVPASRLMRFIRRRMPLPVL